jgi:hypothetical protein
MPGVSSNAAATDTYVALDVHKLAIVAGVLPTVRGEVELHQIENSEPTAGEITTMTRGGSVRAARVAAIRARLSVGCISRASRRCALRSAQARFISVRWERMTSTRSELPNYLPRK